MKQKQRKIGQQQIKSFPVVEMKLYVASEPGAQCMSPGCQGSSAFDMHFFGGEMSMYQSLLENFSTREANEVAWERAYRMQLESKEAWSDAYPVCDEHAQALLEMYVGEEHEKVCTLFLVKAMIAGETIFLFDRNLQRDKHHSSIASGHFESIQEFREKYDAGQGVDFGKLLS